MEPLHVINEIDCCQVWRLPTKSAAKIFYILCLWYWYYKLLSWMQAMFVNFGLAKETGGECYLRWVSYVLVISWVGMISWAFLFFSHYLDFVERLPVGGIVLSFQGVIWLCSLGSVNVLLNVIVHKAVHLAGPTSLVFQHSAYLSCMLQIWWYQSRGRKAGVYWPHPWDSGLDGLEAFQGDYELPVEDALFIFTSGFSFE